MAAATRASEAEILADDILAACREVEIEARGGTVRLTCSIGIVVSEGGVAFDKLYGAADAAAYAAKAAGRDRWVRAGVSQMRQFEPHAYPSVEKSAA